MKKILLFLTLLFIPLFASTSVWKVSKEGNYIYIGGTIHVLSKNDYPLPKQFERAYDDSQILVFEANMEKMNAQESQNLLQQKSLYQNGDSLLNYLENDTYKMLYKYCEKNSLPLGILSQFKPGIATSLITLNALKKLNIVETGVDEYFEQRAKKDRKQLQYLEKVEDQIEFMTSMGIGNENKFVRYTISELKDLPSEMNKLSKAWRSADLEVLEDMVINEFKVEFPKTYNDLLVKRNNNWMPKIEQMFKTKDVEYVLFGAAHLVGNDGILHKLKSLGYKVERVK